MIRAILTSGSMRSLRQKPDRSCATKPGHISCHRQAGVPRLANGCGLWFRRLIGSEIGIMAGKSPVRADEDQRSALIALSRSRDRSEADRARAILLTLSGWTSRQIAEAFGVREDTVRFWRSAFTAGGIEALKTAVAPEPAPVKAERALAVAEEVLSAPVADRPNWTLPRLDARRARLERFFVGD